MSDFSQRISDPMMGTLVNPPAPKVQAPQIFVKEKEESVEERESAEFERQAKLMEELDASSRTRFATGDRDRDLHNFRTFRKAIDSLMGLLE